MRIKHFLCVFLWYWILSVNVLFAQDKTGLKKICFLSDCQQPLKIEELRLKPFHNLEARDSLFASVLHEKPSCLFLLGDLVSKGSDKQLWIPVDNFLNHLQKEKISTYGIPGNHEYFKNAKKGIAQYLARFPESSTNGYSIVTDSIAIVLLNSNFKKLSPKIYLEQQKWFQAKLDSLDKDKSIKAVIVCTHHAPYSNSKIVGSSQAVIKNFVPLFMSSRKAILFITGHSHNLEYFSKGEYKKFIVIGGGGGLSQPLQVPSKRLYEDKIPQSLKPLYFYLMVERTGDKIQLQARGLDGSFTQMKPYFIDRMEIPK